MFVDKSLFLALLVIGVALGVITSDSIGSDMSRCFAGKRTDTTVWLLMGGAIATVGGLGWPGSRLQVTSFPVFYA